MNATFWLLAAFFVVVLGSIVTVGYVVLNRSSEEESGGGASSETGSKKGPIKSPQEILARTLRVVGESVPASKKDNEPLRKRLSMAGYRWPTAVNIFYGLRIASALSLAGFLGWIVLLVKGDSQDALLPAFCAAGFGYLLPDRILDARIRARARNIRRGMAAAVDLLVLALEAGQPLDQAMHDVARALARSYAELSEEFMFFHLEVRAGKTRADALRGLADRCDEKEVRRLVSVLLDGDRFGTSLGPALRTHARYLRTRTRQQAQESARKLTVKLTMPTFFLIFPAVLVVTLGPAYLQLREGLDRLLNGL